MSAAEPLPAAPALRAPTSGPAAEAAPALAEHLFYTSAEALEVARGGPTMDVALIDAEWLLQLQGPPMCRQQLPDEAFFRGAMNAEDVELLAISYPWLTKRHPDPEGWHLAIVQHFLRLYFTLENKGGARGMYDRPPLGQGKRVAVFWDWMSLFQATHPGGQTQDQMASFIRALTNINVWYAHSKTMVWRLTKLPPAPRPGHGVNPYDRRGWCFFEKAVSEMITPSERVLDLGEAVADDGTCREGNGFFSKRGYGGWVAAQDDPHGAAFPTVVKRCRRDRQFPTPPELFNEKLDQCVFTNGRVDADMVKIKYERTFQNVVAEAAHLNFRNAHIFCDLAALAPTLEVCRDRLRILDLSRNRKITGTLDVISICENLETLDLEQDLNLEGTLQPLLALINLRHLNVKGCSKINGLEDFRAQRPDCTVIR